MTSELTIILPIYNPPNFWYFSLKNSLHRIDRLFSDVTYKIVLVNDGSSFSLKKEIIHLQNMFPNLIFESYNHNKGKGFAIRRGMEKYDSSYYIYSDWDFPFGEDIILVIYKLLKKNTSNLIVAKRNQEQMFYNHSPFLRTLISKSLRVVNFIIFKEKIDTQAGLKGLDKTAKNIFMSVKTNSFVFEVEFFKKIIAKKINYQHIEVRLRNDIIFTNFKLKVIFKEFHNYIKLLMRE